MIKFTITWLSIGFIAALLFWLLIGCGGGDGVVSKGGLKNWTAKATFERVDKERED